MSHKVKCDGGIGSPIYDFVLMSMITIYSYISLFSHLKLFRITTYQWREILVPIFTLNIEKDRIPSTLNFI